MLTSRKNTKKPLVTTIMTTLTSYNNHQITTNTDTDNQVIKLWLALKSKSTQKTYQSTVKQFLTFLNDKALRFVSFDDIMSYKDYLENDRNYKSSTINNKLATIKSLFSHSLKIGYIKVNPSLMLKTAINHSKRANKFIKEDRLMNMLNEFEVKNNSDLKALNMVKIAYLLGLRVSELINLKFSDFTCIGDRYIVNIIGKGNKERNLTLSLESYNKFVAPLNNSTGYLFIGNKGKKITRQGAYKIFKKVLKVSPHTTRHNHAMHALLKGCDIYTIKKTLGHSDIKTTSIYLESLPTSGSTEFLSMV